MGSWRCNFNGNYFEASGLKAVPVKKCWPAREATGQRRPPTGFASTRAQGRQLVRHNHVLVNGKRVNIPSYQVKPNDKIEIREEVARWPTSGLSGGIR